MVLKVFFTFLPYKPKFCQFLPNKDHKWSLQKFHTTYCEEKIDDYEPIDSFVTAVKAACTRKLLRLLPDKCMVRLVMKLVGNRSFTLTTVNPNATGYDVSRSASLKDQSWHLFSTSTYLTCRLPLQKVCIRLNLAVVHADGDWQTVEGVQSKDMATAGEYHQT